MKSTDSDASKALLSSDDEHPFLVTDVSPQDCQEHAEDVLLAEIIRARSGGETVSVNIDDMIAAAEAGISENQDGMRPIHPGEILREEFLEPLDISPAALARALHVSAPTVNEIVRERRGVTADMAIRLGRYFDTSAQFWMNLQTDYSLATTFAANGQEIEQEIEPLRAQA